MPSGLFYFYYSDWSVSNRRGSGLQYIIITMFIEIPVFNANNVDTDQTPPFAASDLDLLYLPMSLLWDSRHNGLKY